LKEAEGKSETDQIVTHVEYTGGPVDMVACGLKAFECAFPARERESYKKRIVYDSTAVPQRGKRVCRIGRLPYISTYGKM
jgi:hypothetical protein